MDADCGRNASRVECMERVDKAGKPDRFFHESLHSQNRAVSRKNTIFHTAHNTLLLLLLLYY